MALSPYYAGQVWPEYKFVEFPKMVDGVICQNADEELEVLKRPQPAAEPAAPSADMADLQAQIAALQAQLAARPAADVDGVDERSELLGKAEAHGITVDRRWGIERLRSALEGV